jgi:Ca2+-binding EF-hand superfamily protein
MDFRVVLVEAMLMPIPVLVLPLLLAGAPAPSITVTGHGWAPFVSPMGEPFRSFTAGDDAFGRWFSGADRNHDGVLTVEEMVADGDRFFATLDTDHDGEIDPTELDRYELEIAPEVQVTSRPMRAPGTPRDEQWHERRPKRGREYDSVMGFGGALQGGARYALLNIPEPVAAADTDFNRGVSHEEFRLAAARRFQLLDSGKTGRLTLAQLEGRLPTSARKKANDDTPDARVGNGLPPSN